MSELDDVIASQSGYLESAEATVVWRPLRFAYLVRPGSRTDLKRAIEYACTEWGGISHPILAPDKRGRVAPLHLQIAHTLKPDAVINIGHLDTRRVERLASAIGADPNLADSHSFGLHPLAIDTTADQRARTLIVPRRPRGTLAEAVAIGAIPPGQLDEWVEDFGAVAPALSPIDLLDAQLDVPSPLAVTRGGTATVSHSAWAGAPVIVDCWPMTFQRALWIWNLRALAVPGFDGLQTSLVWLPEVALDDAGVQERLRDVCMNSVSDPDLILNGPHADHLHEVARAMGLAEMPGTNIKSQLGPRRGARDLRARPLQYRLNKHPAVWLLGDRRYGRGVRVPVPVTKPTTVFRVESPIVTRPKRGGYVRVSVGGIDPLRWPNHPSVARLIENNATYRDGAIGVVTTTASSFTFKLRVPEAEEVASAIVGERGWDWEVSDKGRYATGVASLVGDQVSALASREMLAFVQCFVSLSSRKAEQLLKRLPSTDERGRALLAERALAREQRWRTLGDVATEMGRNGFRVGKSQLLPLANRLLKAGLLSRSFKVSCGACGLPWVTRLEDASDVVTCPGCRTTQVLAEPNAEEPRFAYGLNSLLDRAMDQDCVPHLFVDMLLRREHAVVWSVPGANLLGTDGAMREVDVLGLSHDKLFVAEVKTRSAEFTRPFTKNLATLAQR